jgi:hypothetical protein
MTETQQRFLRAIAERVPPEQVVEVHLFPAIRQGGVETGVAVVAEDPRKRVPEVVPVTVENNGTAEAAFAEHGGVEEARIVAATVGVAEADSAEADSAEVDDAEVGAAEPELAETAAAETGVTGAEAVLPEPDPEPESESEEDQAEPPRSRFTIHTARYRLTLKGVDRGKWEVDVVAEADAPLDAVEAVVRGVQRRSGEGADPDRLSTEGFREALDAPLAQLER